MAKKPNIQFISADWKECSDSLVIDLKKTLKAFNLHVYDHPSYEGTDAVGLVIADQKLTKKQLEDFAENN